MRWESMSWCRLSWHKHSTPSPSILYLMLIFAYDKQASSHLKPKNLTIAATLRLYPQLTSSIIIQYRVLVNCLNRIPFPKIIQENVCCYLYVSWCSLRWYTFHYLIREAIMWKLNTRAIIHKGQEYYHHGTPLISLLLLSTTH